MTIRKKDDDGNDEDDADYDIIIIIIIIWFTAICNIYYLSTATAATTCICFSAATPIFDLTLTNDKHTNLITHGIYRPYAYII